MLQGNTWIQDDEPGTPSACQEWIQPTAGTRYFRNTTNTAWVYHGRIDEELGGAVSKGGDMMGGPLLGSHGLPPQTDPDFNGTVRQEGLPVALQRHLAALERRLMDRQASEVRRIFASKTQMSAVAQSLAFESAFVTKTINAFTTDGVAIDLPTFKSDNQVATPDQVLGYGLDVMGFMAFDTGVHDASHDRAFYLWGEPSPRLFKILNAYSIRPDISTHTVRTWILAVR